MKIENSKKAISNYFDASNRMRWGILTVIIVIFTLLLYPNLVITKHQYSLGDVAERDIKAPKNFFVELRKKTLTGQLSHSGLFSCPPRASL